jgi:septin family protein
MSSKEPMEKPVLNLYVLGEPLSGKTTLIENLLSQMVVISQFLSLSYFLTSCQHDCFPEANSTLQGLESSQVSESIKENNRKLFETETKKWAMKIIGMVSRRTQVESALSYFYG